MKHCLLFTCNYYQKPMLFLPMLHKCTRHISQSGKIQDQMQNACLWVGNPSRWRLQLTALLLCHMSDFDYRYRWVFFWADMWSHMCELPRWFSVSVQQRLHHVWTGPLRRWVYTRWRELRITTWAKHTRAQFRKVLGQKSIKKVSTRSLMCWKNGPCNYNNDFPFSFQI